jgi:hypothetical protein
MGIAAALIIAVPLWVLVVMLDDRLTKILNAAARSRAHD